MTRRRPSPPPLHFLPPGAARPGRLAGSRCGRPGRESEAGQASEKRRPRSGRASDKHPLSLAALTTTPLTPTPKPGAAWGASRAPWRRGLTDSWWGEGKEHNHHPQHSWRLLEPRHRRLSGVRRVGNPDLPGRVNPGPDLDIGSSVLLRSHFQCLWGLGL